MDTPRLLLTLVVAGLHPGSIRDLAAQAPAPPPAATPRPAPPTAEALDQIVQQFLDAYNTGNVPKFFSVYVGANVEKPDQKAYVAVVGGAHRDFGVFQSRVMRREWNDLESEMPRITYSAKFKKLANANLSFVFKRTPAGFKIDQFSILDGNVNN